MKGYVIETIQSIVFGVPEEIFKILGMGSDDYIGNSYVGRINLTIEHLVQDLYKKE
jgi:hypothetical protein